MTNRKRRPDGPQTKDDRAQKGTVMRDHGMKAHAAMAVPTVRAATVRVPKASEQKEPAPKVHAAIVRRAVVVRPKLAASPGEAKTVGEEIRSQVVNPSRAVNHDRRVSPGRPVPKAKKPIADRRASRGSQEVVVGVATVRRAVVVRKAHRDRQVHRAAPRRKTRRAHRDHPADRTPHAAKAHRRPHRHRTEAAVHRNPVNVAAVVVEVGVVGAKVQPRKAVPRTVAPRSRRFKEPRQVVKPAPKTADELPRSPHPAQCGHRMTTMTTSPRPKAPPHRQTVTTTKRARSSGCGPFRSLSCRRKCRSRWPTSARCASVPPG